MCSHKGLVSQNPIASQWGFLPEVMAYKEYDASVDIYSFGMIIYKLFVDFPFIDKTNYEIIALVKKKHRPVIPKLNNVTKLIIKCP